MTVHGAAQRALLAFSILSLGTGDVALAADGDRFRFWDRSELSFKKGHAEGIETAVAWGDPANGEYGMITKHRSGAGAGWNTHPNPLYLVVISGTIVVEVEGSPPRELGPGSGVAELPKVKHKVSCKVGADCMSLVTGPKKFGSDPAR